MDKGWHHDEDIRSSEGKDAQVVFGVAFDLVWVNYNDLTRPHSKWFMWGTSLQPLYFRLVCWKMGYVLRTYQAKKVSEDSWLIMDASSDT